jgi:uncharacterized membrane protein YphA (DoxX/SURF4 family)
MKIASTISRYLLGLLFTIFGLNGFLHFIPQPPPSSPLAMQFLTVMSASHYMVPVFLVQLIGGVLLLVGRYIPLALTLLAPVIVNVLIYHSAMDPGGIGAGLLATILWILVFLRFRANFLGLLESRPVSADLR